MNLERLLRPQSIAVFGGREAAQVVLQSERMGFSGDIWPVHPTRGEVHGRRCFRSVADLPSAPDASFIGVNRHLTIDIARELSARGAGGAVCYASGFREAADGAKLEDRLLEAAEGMPILGPNCYGLINYLDGALLWPDQHGGARTETGVAIITQSSNIAINMTMQRRGLPIAYVVTAGNQAQTTLSDIASGLLEDSRVTAIGLHVEGVGDVSRFEAMAFRAREQGKPIVAMTVGRSEQSRAATISHTASIAGGEAASAAFFARLGIPRLRSIPEFLETLKLLHVHGPLPGGDIASMSCSGGEASVMADAAVGRRVRYRPLDASETARVKATLNEIVAVANPLDYHTFAWAKEDAMRATFSAMIGCGFDLSMLVLDFPRLDRCSDADWGHAVRAIIGAARETGGRTAVVASLPENMPEERAAQLMAAGIAPLSGIEEAIAAAEAAAFIGTRWKEPLPQAILPFSYREKVTATRRAAQRVAAWRERADEGLETSPQRAVAPHPPARAKPLWRGEGPSPSATPSPHGREGSAPLPVISEAEAKERLAAFGVSVPSARVAHSVDESIAAAEVVGYPVVAKALGVPHKSEAGAVRLNLRNAAEVEEAAKALSGLGNGLLIESMIADSVAELLIGVTRDPQFGLLMTIATGGVLVELLGDSASLLLPASEGDIQAAILSLKTAPLLQGFRGRPVGDLNAAVAAALAIARFAEEHAETLEELDVNPLIVRPEGKGAVAVDALIRMREA
jgi:acyl-CoA synthetase (NDP forming)